MFAAVLSPDAPAPIGPYSQAVRCGEWLFLSGQIPLDPTSGQIVGDTTADQCRQVLANLAAVLRAAGLEPRHVAKTTIFLVDLADFPTVNELYAEFFSAIAVPPARSTVQVAALPRGARIEIEAIAIRS
jgi:2-iminobutanoate/2-iminopropanoate deaminase